MNQSKNDPSCIRILYSSRGGDGQKLRGKRKTLSNKSYHHQKDMHLQGTTEFLGSLRRPRSSEYSPSVQGDVSFVEESWTCIFCGRGSHSTIYIETTDASTSYSWLSHENITSAPRTTTVDTLSNLFGPYIICKIPLERESAISSPEICHVEQNHRHVDEHTSRSIRSMEEYSRERCRDQDGSTDLPTGVGSNQFDDQQEEVWFHEECITWASGILISGGRLYGLEDAIRTASETTCDSCGSLGSTSSCQKIGCASTSHYCCAVASGWFFDHKCYVSWCPRHEGIPAPRYAQ